MKDVEKNIDLLRQWNESKWLACVQCIKERWESYFDILFNGSHTKD